MNRTVPRGAGRITNLALLVLSSVAGVTGALAFGIDGDGVRWILIAHGIAGLAILAMGPWKSAIAARGIRRHRGRSAPSLVLAVLLILVILTGLGHSTGLLVSVGFVTTMQVHVGAAVSSLALFGWHVLARPVRPRRTDLSRRNALRLGLVGGAAAVGYGGIELVTHVVGLPGSDRRSSGSYERGSGVPSEMPVTQWLNDEVQAVDPARSTLIVRDASGERRIDYEELDARRVPIRAVLDCTGGWWSDQEWEGVTLGELLTGADRASSFEVTSFTGYGRRLPAADAGRLLIATRVGGEPLSAGHGFPARLVAPGRRGFWWVKWVERIALSDVPSWWQVPFPTA